MGLASTKEEQIVFNKRQTMSRSSPLPNSTSFTKTKEDACSVLLLGTGFSGKSTLFYQMSKLDEQKKDTKNIIMGHIPSIYYNAYLITMEVGKDCESKNTFEKETSKKLFKKMEEFGKDASSNISFIEVLKGTEKGKIYPIFNTLIELWNDNGMVTHLLNQKNSLYYFDGVEWFCRLDTLERMKSVEYFPTETDILRSRKKTTGINKIRLESKTMKYEFIDVGGQQNERRKWKVCFKEADILLYIVSLSDFDEVIWEDNSINRMKEALETFEQTVNNDYFSDTPLVVVFNKEDLLVKKIQEKDTLKENFPDYKGDKDPAIALQFIQDMFLNLYKGNPEKLHHLHCQLLDFDHVQEGFTLLEQVSNKLKKEGKIKKKEMKQE